MITPDNFENIVDTALSKLPPCAVILAAVSGGADSTAMVVSLAGLRDSRVFKLYALHVQHNLRGDESRADECAVLALCERLGVPCGVARVQAGSIEKTARDTGCGIEAAARDARLNALAAEAARIKAAFVAIAHTKGDNLETLIMRVLRGSGPAGLSGLHEFSPFPIQHSALTIIRPLLQVDRASVTDYLNAKNIAWQTDSTNANESYLRNRVRARLLPVLDEYFCGWRRGLLAMAETQKITADFLTKEAALHRGGQTDFWALPQILREEILFQEIDALPPPVSELPDMPDPPPSKKTPRRSTIRSFAAGIKGITIQENAPVTDSGASLLIKESGVYKLNGLTIECAICSNKDGAVRLIVHR